MNIYYLKKFRKKAQRVIKARYNPWFLGDKYPYDCSENGFYILDSSAKDLRRIKQVLLTHRRDYVLKLVEKKKVEKLNKQLAKL